MVVARASGGAGAGSTYACLAISGGQRAVCKELNAPPDLFGPSYSSTVAVIPF